MEMGLADFISVKDPFALRSRKNELQDGGLPLLEETKSLVVFPTEETPTLVTRTIEDNITSATELRKRIKRVHVSDSDSDLDPKPLERKLALAMEAPGLTKKKSFAAKKFYLPASNSVVEGASVNLKEVEDESTSVFHVGSMALDSQSVLKRRAVISSSSFRNDYSGDEAPSLLPNNIEVSYSQDPQRPTFKTALASVIDSEETPPHDKLFESNTVNAIGADEQYHPMWLAKNKYRLEDARVCRSFIDNLSTSAQVSSLRSLSNEDFANHYNIGLSQVVCMGSELRLRWEHELQKNKSLERKIKRRDVVIHDKNKKIQNLGENIYSLERSDGELTKLRERVKLLESQVEETSLLRDKVRSFESKELEVVDLRNKNSALESKVSILESLRDDLREKIKGEVVMRREIEEMLAAQKEQFDIDIAGLGKRVLVLKEQYDGHIRPLLDDRTWLITKGFKAAAHKLRTSEEFNSALGLCISMAIEDGIRQGLVAGVVHGQNKVSLADVPAYHPDAKDRFISSLAAFENMRFPLLDQIVELVHQPLDHLKDLLRVSGDLANHPSCSDQTRVLVDKECLIISDEGECALSVKLNKCIQARVNGGRKVQPPAQRSADVAVDD